MKIRNGFVSNSSSSSFTCDVCHSTESGMDLSLREAGMYSCENGHTFCIDHAKKNFESLSTEELKELLKKFANKERLAEIETLNDEELEEMFEEYRSEMTYEYPAELCPLCLFDELSDGDLITYVFSTNGKTRKDFANEIKSQVKNYNEFIEKFVSKKAN